MTARLGLGTAQLGGAYGLAGRGAAVPPAEVRAILQGARGHGIGLLDTAPAYGTAEQVLGSLQPLAAAFAIVTKTPAGGGAAGVRPGLRASLARLCAPRVAALLVHDRRELLADSGDALFAELAALRDEGLCERIGVSVYHPEEALALTARYPLQVVQLPLNVFDQRAHASGAGAELAARGVEVHARSAFLQGLLLLEPAAVPAALAAARRPLQAFRERARSLGLTPVAAALGFAAAVPGVAVVVCGVDSLAQLEQLAAARDGTVRPADFADLAVHDLGLVDPSRWPARL
jgi:aryl-alcohol dehydrogenase-like predicted oxidoreductase